MRPHIRVTKGDQNQFKYELMQDGEKVCDLTREGILASLAEFVGALGADGGAKFTIAGHEVVASYVDLIEMTMQFASSLRWRN